MSSLCGQIGWVLGAEELGWATGLRPKTLRFLRVQASIIRLSSASLAQLVCYIRCIDPACETIK